MRRSTAAYLIGLVLAVSALGWSIRGASSRRPTGDRHELTFACWGGAQEVKELQELIDSINEREKRFAVKLIPIPSDYDTKLATMMAGHTAPDLFYLSPQYMPAFAKQGALLDLTDMVQNDDTTTTDLSVYYRRVVEVYWQEGRLWGLPWIAQPVIVYCNAGLFREAGVPIPDRDWNWDQFVNTARRLTRDRDGDGDVDQWGFVLNGWPPILMWVWQNGTDIVDPDTGRVRLSDPRVIEAFDFYGALIHKYHVAPPLSVVREMGFSDLFRAGKVAMFMGGAADDMERLPGLEVVTAEVPTGPTGIRATFAWTAGLHISRDTADPGLAFEAWKQVLDAIQHWKIPAPRRDLAAVLETIQPRKAPSAGVIRASMDYMRPPAVFDRQIEWETLFAEELLDKLLGDGVSAAKLIEQSRQTLGDWQ